MKPWSGGCGENSATVNRPGQDSAGRHSRSVPAGMSDPEGPAPVRGVDLDSHSSGVSTQAPGRPVDVRRAV